MLEILKECEPLRKKFDRFCYRHDHWGVRNLAFWLVAVNIAMFVLDTLFGGALAQALFFDPLRIAAGQWWRVFSFMLIPMDSNIIFLFIGMLFLYWVISSLERELGRLRLTIYYFSGVLLCVLFAALYALLYFAAGYPEAGFLSPDRAYGYPLTSYVLNVSVLMAFATFNPDIIIRVFFVLPVKVKWLAIVSAVLLVYPALYPPHTFLSLFPIVGIGNYLLFFAPDFVKAFFRRQKHRGKKISFEKASRDIRRERGFTHKCAVCGVTDTDSPDMEFRYCSLCSGYQCYCSKHIFEHEHTRG